MNETKPTRDLVDVFLLLTSMGALALGAVGTCTLFSLQFFATVAGAGVDGFVDLFTPLSLIVLSLSAVPAAVLGLRAFRGQRGQNQNPSSPTILSTIFLFPIALFIGSQSIGGNFTQTILGALAHIVTASIPVLVAVVLVHRHGPQVSQRRFWGQFLVGAWVIPLLAVITETVLMILGIIVLLIGLVNTPTGEALLQAASNPEVWSTPAISENILAFFEQPLIILLFLGFIVVLVPMLEEALKTLAIWPLLRRRPTSAEAFLSGVLAGAGFALVEALFLSPSGPEWTQTMFARAGATMMHAFTAGLSCWGIGQFLAKRNWKRLLAPYLTAVVMHGLWNLAAIAVAYATLQGQSSELQISSIAASIISISGILILIVLTSVAVLGLIEIPRRLKHGPDFPSPTADSNGTPLTSEKSGQGN